MTSGAPSWVDDVELFNWDSFSKIAEAPTMYDPPQLKPGALRCKCCAWYTQTSGLCSRPVVPCCCAAVLRGCCNRSAEHVSLLPQDIDRWFFQMLSYPNRNCPEGLRGLWWIEGNQLNQEVIMTFEDADWNHGNLVSVARKPSCENRTHAPTCLGMLLLTRESCSCEAKTIQFQVSPDERWISVDGALIYALQPGDRLSWPDGTDVKRHSHDMVGMEYETRHDPRSALLRQYMVRRVAYLDAHGNLAKTNNFLSLQERVSAGQRRIESRSCQYFVCGDGDMDIVNEIHPVQVVRWPKPRLQE